MSKPSSQKAKAGGSKIQDVQGQPELHGERDLASKTLIVLIVLTIIMVILTLVQATGGLPGGTIKRKEESRSCGSHCKQGAWTLAIKMPPAEAKCLAMKSLWQTLTVLIPVGEAISQA